MIVSAEEIFKSFGNHEVLRGVSIQAHPGETIAIMGRSGEGKSTLLHILGTLDQPTKGKLLFLGAPLKNKHLADVRNQHIGFIFQSYHLLEDFTVLDNVMIPLKIARKSGKEKALALLKEVGLEGKENLLAKYLSGGEKQRVAIARALVNDPKLLLADEPTGNLDAYFSEEIQNLLLKTVEKRNAALIVVTHSEAFARKCDRILFLKEGALYNEQS